MPATSKYFSVKELSCQCGCGLYNMNEKFLARIDKFREAFAHPILNPGGCRCPKWNRQVGGVSSSKHLTGEALDIPCRDSLVRGRLLELAVKQGFLGIGIGKILVHIDGRDGPLTVWVY